MDSTIKESVRKVKYNIICDPLEYVGKGRGPDRSVRVAAAITL